VSTVSVDVHTEAFGADGVALRGSAVRHHVSDPSDRDMDQAEQPRHYSSTDDDESEYDGGYAVAFTLPFGSDAGSPHYGAVMTAQLCNSAPTRGVIVYQWRRQDLLQGGTKLEIWS